MNPLDEPNVEVVAARPPPDADWGVNDVPENVGVEPPPSPDNSELVPKVLRINCFLRRFSSSVSLSRATSDLRANAFSCAVAGGGLGLDLPPMLVTL